MSEQNKTDGQYMMNIYYWPDTQPEGFPWCVVISKKPLQFESETEHLNAATAIEARTKLAEWLIERI